MTNERGSFIVAAVFFLFIFLFVAAFGVDLSRYMLLKQKTQHIADSAAMAGGMALNQYRDEPETSEVYDAVLSYIDSAQGPKYVELYDRTGPTDAEHIMVVRRSGESPQYRVGVLAFSNFVPYFLPRSVFGNKNYAIIQQAAAVVKHRTSYRSESIRCAVAAGRSPGDGDINIDGNNFTLGEGGLCSNANITFTEGQAGRFPIYQYTDGDCTNDGEACERRTAMGEQHSLPRPTHDSPDDYAVDFTSFDSWPTCSDGGRVITTRDDTTVTWGGTDDACIEQTSSGYAFTNEQGEQLQLNGGGAVGLYVNGGIRFDANNSGLNGALYSTGSIVVEQNNHAFIGDRDVAGGVALYAEQDLTFDKNSQTVEGIVGADGRVAFHSRGGGHKNIRGMLIGGGGFSDSTNSDANTDITYDPSLFRSGALGGGWGPAQWVAVDKPLFVDPVVHLIY